jgi:hypothetical protein
MIFTRTEMAEVAYLLACVPITWLVWRHEGKVAKRLGWVCDEHTDDPATEYCATPGCNQYDDEIDK